MTEHPYTDEPVSEFDQALDLLGQLWRHKFELLESKNEIVELRNKHGTVPHGIGEAEKVIDARLPIVERHIRELSAALGIDPVAPPPRSVQ